jgi:predicted transcriptional regulator
VSDYNDKREGQKMEFKILTDKNKDDFIEFLKENQYNEEEIKRAQGLYDI